MAVEDFSDRRQLRSTVRKAIQFMNRYGLTELEYEKKDGSESLVLNRGEMENTPPLLEGRSTTGTGVVRSSAVGILKWHREEGETVEEGEAICDIEQHEERVTIEAPQSGSLQSCTGAREVEFGEILCRISAPTRRDEQDESS